jgi:hypothetical protein
MGDKMKRPARPELVNRLKAAARLAAWFPTEDGPEKLADIAPQRLPEPCGHRPMNILYVLSRDWRGLDIRLFEFETIYSPLVTDSTYTTDYSCVVARVPTGRGTVAIESRGVRRKYHDWFAGRDRYRAFGLSLETRDSPRGRRFPRRGQYVATRLSLEDTDRSLHEWLTDLPGDWGFWIDDPWVFCYITPPAVGNYELRPLLEMLNGFIERLPNAEARPD